MEMRRRSIDAGHAVEDLDVAAGGAGAGAGDDVGDAVAADVARGDADAAAEADGVGGEAQELVARGAEGADEVGDAGVGADDEGGLRGGGLEAQAERAGEGKGGDGARVRRTGHGRSPRLGIGQHGTVTPGDMQWNLRGAASYGMETGWG